MADVRTIAGARTKKSATIAFVLSSCTLEAGAAFQSETAFNIGFLSYCYGIYAICILPKKRTVESLLLILAIPCLVAMKAEGLIRLYATVAASWCSVVLAMSLFIESHRDG